MHGITNPHGADFSINASKKMLKRSILTVYIRLLRCLLQFPVLIVMEFRNFGLIYFLFNSLYQFSWVKFLMILLITSLQKLVYALRLFITDWVSAPLEDQGSSYYIWGYVLLSSSTLVAACIATLSIASLYLYFS